MKWEFTRRHPYYQQYWRVVNEYDRAPTFNNSAKYEAEAAKAVLRLINVVDVPPDPATSFDALGGDVPGSVWGSGAIAPATLETLVAILLVTLPSETCTAVGNFMSQYATLTQGSFEERQHAALLYLQNLSRMHPSLASYPIAPILSLNTEASLTAIAEEVNRLAKEFKEKRNLPETRWRTDNLPSYLQAWDLREGWVDGHYDCSKEKTFAQISIELDEPLRTIQNRYRSAFESLIGREYTPELWDRVVATFKFGLLDSNSCVPAVLPRRPRRTRRPIEVPETTLRGRAGEGPDAFRVDRTVSFDEDARSLQQDIFGLLRADRSDADIILELELVNEKAGPLIAYFRAPMQESL